MNADDPLRILIVDDVSADAELAERELRKDGLLFTSMRVDTKEGFLQALEEFRPDVIISDYAMPEFDGMEALKLSLAHDPHLPFILFTGSMNEETAVACMKSGAADYIIKEHIARLPSAVRAVLEQRKIRTEKEEQEKELIAIYENAPLIMLLFDGARRLRKVNGFTAAFTGRPADAMRLMRFGEALRCLNALASPEGCGFGAQCEQCIIRRVMTETLETGKSAHQVEGSLSFGSAGQEKKMSFLLSTARLDSRNRPLVLVTLLDITRRKQAEEAIKESETLLNDTQAISKIGGWTYDLGEKRIIWTDEVYRIYGVEKSYDPNDIGKAISFYSEEDRQIIEQAFTNAVQKGEPYDLALRFHAADGTQKWVRTIGKPVSIDGKITKVMGNIIDITERRQKEEALRESETNFRRSLNESPLGVRIVSAEGETLYVNRTTLDIFGCDSIEEWRTSPTAKRYTEQSYAEFKVRREKRRLGEDDEPEYEIDIVRKDGEVRRLQVWRKGILWNGKKHFQVIYRDITEQKRAESKLRQQTDAMEAAIDGMALLNTEEEYVYLNKAHAKVYGYENDGELMGKSWRILYDSGEIKRFEQDIMPEFSRKGDWHGEAIGMKKNGSKFPQEVSLTAMANGGLICVVRDITERKEAEKELQRTLENLRKSFAATVQVMVSAVETRDPYTAGHQIRSADLARAIASEMGLPQEKIDGIRMAASIHDIGKLSIPAEILSKPTKLSEIEFSLIKEHAHRGFEILKDVESPWPLAEMVYQHHERMDGSGYPRNLKGDDILIEARILAVADVVEAMASFRPYRPSLGIDKALEEIARNRGILYDPEATDVCLKLFQEKGYHLH